jgi:phenylpropionate dioxygenase-like ring-hydroxylating dioxygenase large terminal subunit
MREPQNGWFRSTRCEASACVEVRIAPDAVLIRNSNDPNYHLSFTHEEWQAFVLGAAAGEFGR